MVVRAVLEAIYNLETGLTYVHGVAADAQAPGWMGKVHRDIKPGNIFLKAPATPYDSFPEPVLADIDELLELIGYMNYTRKYHLHTPGYAAPENNEQLRNDDPDERGFGFFAASRYFPKAIFGPLAPSCGR
jgi:serine/threonine protein kinase